MTMQRLGIRRLVAVRLRDPSDGHAARVDLEANLARGEVEDQRRGDLVGVGARVGRRRVHRVHDLQEARGLGLRVVHRGEVRCVGALRLVVVDIGVNLLLSGVVLVHGHHCDGRSAGGTGGSGVSIKGSMWQAVANAEAQ